MPIYSDVLDVVLRFPKVTLSKEAFEAVLTLRLDRFDTSRAGTGHYAQINLPEDSSWDDLGGLIDRIGPPIQSYLQRREISRPRVDAALHFGDRNASASILIPSAIALTIGRWGFDLEVSAYLSSLD